VLQNRLSDKKDCDRYKGGNEDKITYPSVMQCCAFFSTANAFFSLVFSFKDFNSSNLKIFEKKKIDQDMCAIQLKHKRTFTNGHKNSHKKQVNNHKKNALLPSSERLRAIHDIFCVMGDVFLQARGHIQFAEFSDLLHVEVPVVRVLGVASLRHISVVDE